MQRNLTENFYALCIDNVTNERAYYKYFAQFQTHIHTRAHAQYTRRLLFERYSTSKKVFFYCCKQIVNFVQNK